MSAIGMGIALFTNRDAHSAVFLFLDSQHTNVQRSLTEAGFCMANSTKVTHAFSSLHLVTTLLTLLLAMCVLMDVITIAFVFLSREPTEEPQLVRTLLIAAHLIAGVLFLIWLYHERRNLVAVGSRGGRYSSPWAIGLFFVPILNLYYPYDIVRELWKQSNPDVGLSDAFLKQHAATLKQYSSKTALTGLWWGSVIASVVVARISGTIASHATNIPDLITAGWTGMISDALRIVGTIVLMVLVNRIDARLEEKHRRRTLDAATHQVDPL